MQFSYYSKYIECTYACILYSEPTAKTYRWAQDMHPVNCILFAHHHHYHYQPVFIHRNIATWIIMAMYILRVVKHQNTLAMIMMTMMMMGIITNKQSSVIIGINIFLSSSLHPTKHFCTYFYVDAYVKRMHRNILRKCIQQCNSYLYRPLYRHRLA